MQTWEYCAILQGPFSSIDPTYWVHEAFTLSGKKQVGENLSEEKAYATIARLGKDGWEMCGFASNGGGFYFKRPLDK